MKNNLDTIRHSAAHLLAAAVKNLYPKTSLGIGPVIENGFYYDFDSTHTFSEDDFLKLEKTVNRTIKEKVPFQRIEKNISDALTIINQQKDPYKKELILDLKRKGEKKVYFYKPGGFIDLCTGPHVKNTGEIGVVKLLSVAGAYWKGNENNKMLQRIYGTAWNTKNELEVYLKNLEEIKKRNHKKIGHELELFTFLPVAPGMPFWYPKGFTLIEQLKKFVRDINKKNNYREISTPLLAKKEVWETSGHWNLFKKNMFVFKQENQTYSLKPMNCPQTLLLFNTKKHSYKELPLKLSDLDIIHRFEESGTLNGLFRVRELSQDDAHILCTPEQIEEVVEELLDIVDYTYSIFGFKPSFFLANKPDKALGDAKNWALAEAKLKKILERKDIEYKLKEGEGSFYGPKADLHIDDALGRNWQLATIQLDYQMPKRFNSKYTDKNGREQQIVMVHRAILGAFERFLGILIEHYNGAFPTWLSPVQVVIIPIADRHVAHAEKIGKYLTQENIRVEVNSRSETMQARLRDAELQKVPYMIILGDKEKVRNKLSVRSRKKGEEGVKSIESFVQQLDKEISEYK